MAFKEKLYRPYLKNTNTPITRKWFWEEKEAKEWGETFKKPNEDIEIHSKELNEAVKNRKKTGLHGLV